MRLRDIVPADARWLDADSVEVDQSALTGELLPVTGKPGDAIYSGSILRHGETDAFVYGTGSSRYFGRTAHLVESAHTTSHFQLAVLKIGDFLILVAISLVILILLFVALFRDDPMAETLQFAFVLTVAAVPVAMPTVLSVTMAVGARILAHRKRSAGFRRIQRGPLHGIHIGIHQGPGEESEPALVFVDCVTRQRSSRR